MESLSQDDVALEVTTVTDALMEEVVVSAVPVQCDDANDMVSMEEESAKNEKKRSREVETAAEDESAKTPKAAKTETGGAAEVKTSVLTSELWCGAGVNASKGAGTGEGEGEAGKTKRLKKRKIAMIVAYCGAAYQGMQRNPGAITIEGELEQALYRAGAITKENFGVPRKVDWMRAARTDKGVSAIGQVVSGQFIIEPEGFVERVNSFLPKDIVVLGYKRVTASFNAKKLCDKRRYEYIIPVYCFDPSKHLDRETANAMKVEDKEKPSVIAAEGFMEEAKTVGGETVTSTEVKETVVDGEVVILTEVTEESKNGSGETLTSVEDKNERPNGPTVLQAEVKEKLVDGEVCVKTVVKEDVESGAGVTPPQVEGKSAYRFDESEMNRLNRVLARYKGTHNYHNFTARTQAEDPSAHRFILSFEAEDVFTVNGIEFVRCHVIGQSFMLHQIRKMVGLAVAIMRGAAPESIMDFALRKDTKLNVPMAPELGLFLEECYYSSYNNKFQSSHEELSLKDFKYAVNEFKKSVIYPHIAATEARESVFPLWLHGMNDRHYPDFVAARQGTYKPGNLLAKNAG
ncbi:hypothetical protein Mapa_014796 [Marchantia paleacea]|nr:hypothetical protein Mapa_014796 [Marchantia paleacea]